MVAKGSQGQKPDPDYSTPSPMRLNSSNSNLNSLQGTPARVRKSGSQTLEEICAVQASTGVANIPNQVHYLHSKRKVNVNVFLFGESGLGKTGIINHVLGQPLLQDSQSQNSEGSVEIRIRRQEVEESGSRALLSVLDLPNFGPRHGKKEAGQAALAYLEDQFELNLREESQHRRSKDHQGNDNRVHTLLYFHNPTAHKLSSLDVELIGKMSKLANVIIVIAKGDTLLRHEYLRIKNNIRDQLHHVKLFNANPEVPVEPFIAVSGADLLATAPARNYLWGSLKIAPSSSPASLSINILTSLLFKDFLPDLILNTQAKYEAWKAEMIKRLNVREEEWKEPAEVLNKIVSKLSDLRMTA